MGGISSAGGILSAVDNFVARLEAVQAGEGAPWGGDPMRAFTLPDQDGKLIGLEEILSEGPALIAFHRGHWCLYCRLNMIGLTEIEDEIAPARIAAPIRAPGSPWMQLP